MTDLDRRAFVRASLGAAGALLVGCGASNDPRDAGADAPPDADATPDVIAPRACDDPFAGGERVGVVPFESTRTEPFGALSGEGLDGRLYTDLAALSPDALVVDNARFFVRTRTPDRLDLSDPAAALRAWRIAVGGLARAPRDVPLTELLALAAPLGTTLVECSGNPASADFGLMSAARWSGVALARVLAMVDPLPAARRVLVSGFDDHSMPSERSRAGASWIFDLDDLARYGAWLVTAMNGAPLPPDHGFPVRLIVPRWYGCCCIKWVNEVRLVDDDAPATDHMLEFASRTMQSGTPSLARDFRPAAMELAAMAVRVERWRVAGRTLYKVVGVVWGGERTDDALEISLDGGFTYEPLAICPARTSADTWALWSHPWTPRNPGRYGIRLRAADRATPTRRLDAGYYNRVVDVAEV